MNRRDTTDRRETALAELTGAALTLLTPVVLFETHHYLILAALIAFAALVVFYKMVLSEAAAKRNRVRTLRWRIRLRLRPATGYASLAELSTRWSRLAAVSHGHHARPGLSLWARLTTRTTDYAVRLGRAQYGRRCFARQEDQVLVLAPQRVGKSGIIADRICDHPGGVLATSTRADLYETTSAVRARRGRVDVFNPQRVGHVPSSLRFDLLGPCRDLVMARRMATWLSGGATARSGHGNIEWFEQKGEVALAGLLFAAAVSAATIADVFRWVQLDGHEKAIKALAQHGTPEMLAVVRRMLADNRTAGSVRDTIELSLAWAAIPELAEAVTPRPGEPVFDVDQLALFNGTLYLIGSGDENSPVTPLFRAIASYVHYQAGIIGTRTRAERLDPPLLMALDEVAVICPIDLPSMLADSAGKGILIQPVVHSLSQLEDRWGKAGAGTIWATCGTKLLLPGISDPETLEAVSKILGTVARGRDEDGHQVRVVPPDLLRALPNWRALVIRMNLSPVVVKVRPVWRRPERRFPLRYLLSQPGRPVFPVAELPELGAGAEEPEPVEAADDLVPVPRPREDTWPFKGDSSR